MRKFIVMAISAVILGGIFASHAQNGFIIHATKGGCERELHYRTITNGTNVGEPKLVVPKGPGADIWPAISYDGEWIAWARATKAHGGKYGGCDYHEFLEWNIYIARIDFGKTIPVKKAINVGKGGFPSWREDARQPNKPKTLYFTNWTTKAIMKTVVQPDGSFSTIEKHADVPGGMSHVQGSPDGKFILCRPSKIKLYSIEAKKYISGGLGGCHPCWGPRSKYFIRSQNGAFFNTGTSVKSLGSAGVGAYFQGMSNDAYWDEGKLWTIGKCGKYSGYGGSQNGEGSIEYNEVAIDGNGDWKLGKRTVVGKGCSPDIHFFPPNFNPETGTITPKKVNISDSRISFTSQIKTTSSGLQLVVYSMDKAAKMAELFDIQGKRVGVMKISSFKNTMSINGIGNGNYILKISGDNVFSQRSILFTR